MSLSRMHEEEARWAADVTAAGALQSQVNELLKMVNDLQGHQISTNQEIRFSEPGWKGSFSTERR